MNPENLANTPEGYHIFRKQTTPTLRPLFYAPALMTG
jgi:hypothetical protein